MKVTISNTKLTMGIPYSLLRIFAVVLLVPFIFPAASSSPEKLSSCLDFHNINNYSISPVSGNKDENQSYFDLLSFSIQNLRFSEFKIPKPVAIILPESVEEVANSVLCCRAGSLEIRIRCGGHSYEGTSSVGGDGGPFVIIDMMNLNQVLVDLDRETAWVEGGATLGETYYAISQSSKVHGFSAGSCPTVGVGGHIGGGGFGLLSRKYGLAADNVIDALLITAEGKLVDRKGMGEDVFWAIRGGGGGNWGIIYAWKIRLLKVPETVTSFAVSRRGSKYDVASLVNKWQHVSPYLDGDFYLSCFLGAGLPNSPVPGISATFKGFFLGSKNQAVSILTRFFPELNVTEEDCVEMTWIESVVYFAGLSNGSTVSDLKNRYLEDKHYFKAKSDYIKEQISLTGIHKAIKVLEKEPKGYVILDPYGGIMNKISTESIPFPHRKGNLFSIQYLVEWHNEEDNENRYMEWIRELYDAMTPYVSKSTPRAAYINYMDFDLGIKGLINERLGQDSRDAVEMARAWGEKYFLGNFDRLVKAKTVIDPDNVFSNEQGIPPLSSSSSLSPLMERNSKFMES